MLYNIKKGRKIAYFDTENEAQKGKNELIYIKYLSPKRSIYYILKKVYILRIYTKEISISVKNNTLYLRRRRVPSV